MDELLAKIKVASEKRLCEIKEYAEAEINDKGQREQRVDLIINFLEEVMQILSSHKLYFCELRGDIHYMSSPGIVINNNWPAASGYYIAFSNSTPCDSESIRGMEHFEKIEDVKNALLSKDYLYIRGIYSLLTKDDAYFRVF